MKSKRTSDRSKISESLQESLEQLSRPIQLASRTPSAQLPRFKNLGAYVSNHILQMLETNILHPSAEANLLSLRQVFLDFDQPLTTTERQARISEAQNLLTRLQASCQPQPGNADSCSIKRVSGNDEQSLDHRTAQHGAMELWNTSIQFAKGVGPARAELLKKLGVTTIEDAFWFLPWRYEDRLVISSICSLQPGIKATIRGTVKSSSMYRTSRRRLMILRVVVDDGTGVLECVFFNQPYLEKTFTEGVHLLVTGIVSIKGPRTAPCQMRSPQYETLEADDSLAQEVGKIIPVYHETRGITSRQLRRILLGLHHQFHHGVEETLPSSLSAKLGLPSLAESLVQVHFPDQEQDIDRLNNGTTPAHQRLAFEELLVLQLALSLRQQTMKTEVPGISFSVDNHLVSNLGANLPFSLTPSQEQVIQEIREDMAQPKCMNRLIQGDVGSGKTIVALHAIVMACGSGYQTALMAPTEILSEQHYMTLARYFRALGVKAVLVKGGQTKRERSRVLEQLHSGEAHIAIGTHALLQPDIQFAKLGLVVVDEQHKFGVLQRARLKDKGEPRPDMLVMTATPIPRTLAMTVYGDLDVSAINELPPGRKIVRTLLFRSGERKQAYALLRKEIEAGRQVYIVYPLVEESEKLDLQDAIKAAQKLQQKEFPTQKIGLLHGRMKSEEKQSIMDRFKEGQIHILVTTTVIEVGVDVPNATVMMVEHADRFGLAQLHQLRGRVGRGSHQAYCLLVSGSVNRPLIPVPAPFSRKLPFGMDGPYSRTVNPFSKSPERSARQRLEVLVNCSDGFALAEEDLKIRGPGDFLGVRQWGELDFRVADLIRDHELLVQARTMATGLLQADPELTQSHNQRLKEAVFRRWGAKFELGSVG